MVRAEPWGRPVLVGGSWRVPPRRVGKLPQTLGGGFGARQRVSLTPRVWFLDLHKDCTYVFDVNQRMPTCRTARQPVGAKDGPQGPPPLLPLLPVDAGREGKGAVDGLDVVQAKHLSQPDTPADAQRRAGEPHALGFEVSEQDPTLGMAQGEDIVAVRLGVISCVSDSGARLSIVPTYLELIMFNVIPCPLVEWLG